MSTDGCWEEQILVSSGLRPPERSITHVPEMVLYHARGGGGGGRGREGRGGVTDREEVENVNRKGPGNGEGLVVFQRVNSRVISGSS